MLTGYLDFVGLVNELDLNECTLGMELVYRGLAIYCIRSLAASQASVTASSAPDIMTKIVPRHCQMPPPPPPPQQARLPLV